jgi:hypothetical protein
VLVGDETTGRWLFSKNGQPIKSIKKGFSSACERAGIEDLRPYDLRHTFATRLVERNVQTIIISELLGHTQQWSIVPGQRWLGFFINRLPSGNLMFMMALHFLKSQSAAGDGPRRTIPRRNSWRQT